jgi:hypothetical protein
MNVNVHAVTSIDRIHWTDQTHPPRHTNIDRSTPGGDGIDRYCVGQLTQ